MVQLNDILEQIRSYHPTADTDLIRRAHDFCLQAHAGQKSLSGDPYIQQLLELASILTRLKVDETTLVVGLLHESLEKAGMPEAELEDAFGAEILSLVQVGTRISRIPYRKSSQQQVESFRKMFVSMARDLRVILVCLADRLCEMRQLQYRSDREQVDYARETLEIFAPLANRLGISWLKSELEDLALSFLEPDKYRELASRVSRHKEEQKRYIADIRERIEAMLGAEGIKGDITGRFKHFYSIYKKMERTGVELDQIYDLAAFRVLVTTVRECYEVLGIIHAAWKPIPGRFKDYIAMPKTNMYQSLHSTVIGPYGGRIEIQIRTHEMHRIAEEGVAAHWKYKEGGAMSARGRDDQRFGWLRQLLEWQQDVSASNDYPVAGAGDLFSDEVYAFTPNGDVKALPAGASPVDFAYAIHTDVGSQCVGARINGKLCPLKTELKNGDIVEVITSANHKPSKDWLAFVKTSKARNKIRHWIKSQQQEKSVELGRELIEKELRKHQYSFKRAQALDSFSKGIGDLGFKSLEGLLASVGYGKLSPGQAVSHLLPKEELKVTGGRSPGALGKVFGKLSRRKPSSAILIDGIDDIMVRFANCCNPVQGEPVVGYITRGRGLTVHAADCSQVLADDPERMIEVAWDMQRKTTRPVKIRIFCHNKKGMLVSISGAITEADGNIVSASVQSTEDGKGINLFEVEVENLEHLNRVVREVNKIKGVYRVERLRS